MLTTQYDRLMITLLTMNVDALKRARTHQHNLDCALTGQRVYPNLSGVSPLGKNLLYGTGRTGQGGSGKREYGE